jgi:alcohol dehydrogenase class IV
LPDALAATGIKRPLFVTDPGLAKLPVVASTLKILLDAGRSNTACSPTSAEPGGIQSHRRHRGVQEGQA